MAYTNDTIPTIAKQQTFAVLVRRKDGEWGLLTTCSPRNFDSGDFDKATAKAWRSIRRKTDAWRETVMIAQQVSLAVIEFAIDGSWKLERVL